MRHPEKPSSRKAPESLIVFILLSVLLITVYWFITFITTRIGNKEVAIVKYEHVIKTKDEYPDCAKLVNEHGILTESIYQKYYKCVQTERKNRLRRKLNDD